MIQTIQRFLKFYSTIILWFFINFFVISIVLRSPSIAQGRDVIPAVLTKKTADNRMV